MTTMILINFYLILTYNVTNVRNYLIYNMHIMLNGKQENVRFLFFNVAHVAYFIINYLLFNLKDNYG